MCDDRRIKFIYSEKATKFEEIILLVLTLLNLVKTKGKSSSNFSDFLRKTQLYCTLRHRAVPPPSLWSRGEIKWLKKIASTDLELKGVALNRWLEKYTKPIITHNIITICIMKIWLNKMQRLTTLHIMLHHVKFVISPNSSDSLENSLCLITDILCIDFYCSKSSKATK